jgi:hypothetical protein
MHVWSADWKAGAWMFIVAGSLAPRIEIDEPAGAGLPGSGNWGTPWARMHLANVTVPGPGPEPVWADATGPPDPQAATATARASAIAVAVGHLTSDMCPVSTADRLTTT